MLPKNCMATRPPSPSLISQNHLIKTKRKPFSQKKELICKFHFNNLCMESQNQTCINSKTFRNYIKSLRIWNGLSPLQFLALCAKVWLFATILLFKTIKSFSVKSEGLRRGQPMSYTEWFLFVLSFNVAPYFQLKKLVFLCNHTANWPDRILVPYSTKWSDGSILQCADWAKYWGECPKPYRWTIQNIRMNQRKI